MTGSAAEGDHLAALLVTGPAASSGGYTPIRSELKLLGHDLATDQLVYVHEVHHAALNDSTAWGTVLHLLARLPESYRDGLLSLLDDCRAVHEALATYASVNLVSAFHADAEAALRQYPAYMSLYHTMAGLVEGVTGQHRRALAANAIARICMQTPVLESFVASGPALLRPASLRVRDTPGWRWNWICRHGAPVITRAARRADRIVGEREPGALALDVPGSEPLDVAASRFDTAWHVWETTAYEVLGQALGAVGAVALAFDGHQARTQDAVRVAREIYPGLRGITADRLSPAPTDRDLAASVIRQVRHDFSAGSGGRPRARLLPSDADNPVLTTANAVRVEGRPVLVADVRMPLRLAELFAWPDQDRLWLAEATGPLTAIRTITAEEGGEVVWHARLASPEALAALADAWEGEGGIVVSCVATSCLIDRDWQRKWLPAMNQTGSLIMLIDLDLDWLIPGWRRQGSKLMASRVTVDDPSGQREGLVLQVPGRAEQWIALADLVTVNLLLDQLRATTDLNVASPPDQLADRLDVLRVVYSHLLASESFLGFTGLEGYL
jgi:hypothetical protein